MATLRVRCPGRLQIGIGVLSHSGKANVAAAYRDWSATLSRGGLSKDNNFIEQSGDNAAGWFSFYWGKPPEELRRSKEIGDAILLQLLELFERRSRATMRFERDGGG